MDGMFDDLMDMVGGDKSVTYVCFVQDHSGSMGQLLDGDDKYTRASAQMENYNEQMAVLRRETDDMETLVTLIEFDDRIKVRYQNVPCDEAIDIAEYWLGGMTSLYDAVGKGISLVEEELEKDTRPNKAALMIIQTDGLENKSKEYTRSILKGKIKKLEDTGIWTFVFLGENLDKDISADVSALNTHVHGATMAEYKMSNDMFKGGLENYYSYRKRGVTKSDNMMDPGPASVDEFTQVLKKAEKKLAKDDKNV